MRFVIFLFASFFLLTSFSVNAFQKPARRIITLAPNLAEIAFTAGAGHFVVGVSSFSDFPKAASKLPVVASYNGLDVERILALQPDLVIAWSSGNSMSEVNRLKHFGIPVYEAVFHHLIDVANVMLDIGHLTGQDKIARKVSQKFQQHYKRLLRRYRHRKPVTIFYEVSAHPLMTLNRHTSVGQVISLCGGKNIFADTPTVSPEISIESVLKANPDVILVSSQTGQENEWVKEWNAYPKLRAVRKHRVFAVEADLLERYGPRILNGADRVCRLL